MTAQGTALGCPHPAEAVEVVDYESGLHVYCRRCRRDLRWVLRREDGDERD